MAQEIRGVEPGSIADQLGIRPGDRLVSINGEPVFDLIDYQALCAEEQIDLSIRRDGESLEFAFEKDEYEALGLEFADAMMSGIRNCCNECVFCFVDQLPRNVRESMRVKDDDWRTSLMMGSFVTLTNVGPKEIQRIIRRNASPLYISAHATDDALRAELLGTARGMGLMNQLRALSQGGIEFHLQAVLCPGLNDGAALRQTIGDLAGLMPSALSLALVPVGLTGHRDGLPGLKPYDRDSAEAVLQIADEWRKALLKRHGTRFVFPADELYLLAGRAFPLDEAYEGYLQIDNGVGLCRLLETEFDEAYLAWRGGAAPVKGNRQVAIACGVSVAPFMKALLDNHPIPGVEITVHCVENRFFGPTVTVSGLITGSDLIRGMEGVQADRILITECMLRDGEEVFLDDVTLAQARAEIGVPITPVGRSGEDLLHAIICPESGILDIP